MNSKDQILQVVPKTETVTLPGWGGDVIVRGMTGTERDEFEAHNFVLSNRGSSPERGMKNFRARLIVKCVVDETGARVFDDADAEKLGATAGDDISKLYDVAARLSGIGKPELQDAAKN